ncbi:MAG: hypothetical protein A2Y64_03690 [Candidatus Coatesbacteria bacterium RBG_13_66_14]|uniref:DUF4296 domain-containing protein n=1 Tax=Candidatus Coatesbacteria bacterium RBG_13_66_14 TaxID=1817816 RepID=A0A1F5EXG0_9BACT|nr:MAG: hypothetical protein A2Y64_03690 [Candidatus Coatesbacteria bacterium RBG_13_66_14]
MIISGRTSPRCGAAWLLGVLAVAAGFLLPGCGELDDETYIAVMVEYLRLGAEEGLPQPEALAEAARLHGTTAQSVYEYSRWLFRDRDTDVEVAAEIARRGQRYLSVPREGLPNPHEP